MYPELFRIPIFGLPVKSYGFMLMIGFLTAIWLSMRRAERVKADPDLVLNIGFVSLICGVAGARAFYVAHYWQSQFAFLPNPLWSAVNITAGGLEFYGGLLCAIAGASVYLLIRRASWRMYMDIVAPSVMWGLAFGRAGCFLNGCCWGGLCVDAQNHAALPWAIRFPYGSPAFVRQWENRQVTAPAELVFVSPASGEAYPIPRDLLDMSPEEREGPQRRLADLREELDKAKLKNPNDPATRKTESQVAALDATVRSLKNRLAPLQGAQRFPSRVDPSRRITVSELEDLAAAHPSRPVHPTQLYGILNAFLLSWVLSLLFYRRKRHGLVIAMMMVLYPITRILEEFVRVDNPHDSFGLTISQAVSLGVFALGVAVLVILYRSLPLRSPRAVPFIPPEAPAKT